MTSYVYSARLYGPLATLHRRVEREALQKEWERIKKEVDTSFAELDEADFKLSVRDVESGKGCGLLTTTTRHSTDGEENMPEI